MKNISYARGLGMIGFTIGIIIVVYSIIVPSSAFLLSVMACGPVLAVLTIIVELLSPILKSLNIFSDSNVIAAVLIYGPIYGSPIVYGLLGLLVGHYYEKIKEG